MLKKILLPVAGVLLLASLLFGRGALSYLGTTVGLVSDNVRSAVPIEFELQRARKMIADLGPEISRHKREVAREELTLRKSEQELEDHETDLANKWHDITRLRDDLQRGDSNFVYAGVSYSSDQVEKDLTSRFERYEKMDSTVKMKRQIHEARCKALTAAQDKLTALIAAKRKLELEIENLEARLKMVEVAKTTSELNIDDSQLSRTRELLSDIEARIEVDAELVNAEDLRPDEIQLDEPEEDADILERITRYEADRAPAETFAKINIEN